MKILNLPDELQTQVYLPETIDECRKINCTDCICLSHRQEGCPCQFNVYLATRAAKKTAEPAMLKGCIKGNAKPANSTVRHQRYRIERVVVKADGTPDSNIAIPDNAIMMKHAIITPGRFSFERDLVHVITWLEPIK